MYILFIICFNYYFTYMISLGLKGCAWSPYLVLHQKAHYGNTITVC